MTNPATFVCQLDALTPVERVRQRELTNLLAKEQVGLVELDDGWKVQLEPSAETLAAAAEWLAYETRCCPFLGFLLESRCEGPISVRLTGETGAKEFIAETFGMFRP